jgi:hypothetical protein
VLRIKDEVAAGECPVVSLAHVPDGDVWCDTSSGPPHEPIALAARRPIILSLELGGIGYLTGYARDFDSGGPATGRFKPAP